MDTIWLIFYTSIGLSLFHTGLILSAYVKREKTTSPTVLSFWDINQPGSRLLYTPNESRTKSEALIEANSFACGRYYFCNWTHGEYERPAPCLECHSCRCDLQCHNYGDCCADLRGVEIKSSEAWTCVRRIDNEYGVRHETFAMMVASCPTKLNTLSRKEDIVSKCENPDETNIDEVRPVTNPQTQVTYRNRYCSICNGVSNVKFWGVYAECELGAVPISDVTRIELARFILASSKCAVRDIAPVGITARPCHGAYIDKCNLALRGDYSNITETLCTSASGSPVTVTGKIYRNVFCALCNGAVLDRYCSGTSLTIPAVPQPTIPSMKVLIGLNPIKNEVTEKQEDRTCSDNESYDPLTRNCLPVKCSPRRYYSNGECEPMFVSAEAMGYELSLAVIFSQPLETTRFLEVVNIYVEQVKLTIERFEPFNRFFLEYKDMTRRRSVNGSYVIDVVGFLLKLEIAPSTSENLSTTEETFRKLKDFVVTLPVDGHNVTFHTNVVNCPASLPEQIPGQMAEHFRSLGRGIDYCPTFSCNYEMIPLYSTLDCPHIQINLTDVEHTYNAVNSTLRIYLTGIDKVLPNLINLNKSAHLYCKGILKICRAMLADIQLQLSTQQNVFSFLGIVSAVCVSVSLMCLFVTFTVYCLLPQLRTLPGKNTMALILHLFCAQLVFQCSGSATVNYQTCSAMGIMIHYLWLTTFAWLAICAYHMYSAFHNMTQLSRTRSSSSHTQAIVKYTVSCHILAFTIVSACLVYNLVASAGKDFGYGLIGICFLNKPNDLSIFFATPVAIILVFNFVCFVKIVLTARALPTMERAKNIPDKTHLNAYIGLSFLIGFTWLFGILASASRSETFWYLFVIFNGLHGVFIAIAYCFNRRIFNMLKARLLRTETTTLSTTLSKPECPVNTQSTSMSRQNAATDSPQTEFPRSNLTVDIQPTDLSVSDSLGDKPAPALPEPNLTEKTSSIISARQQSPEHIQSTG